MSIGALIPLTGGSADPEWRDAAELALADVNDGLKQADVGYRFRLDVTDQPNPADAEEKARDLVDGGAKALLTWMAPQGALNALAYDDDEDNDLNVPLLPAAASSGLLNNPMQEDNQWRNDDRWTFAMCMASSFEALVATRIVLAKGDNGDVNGDGVFKMSMYVIDNGYGNSYANALEQHTLDLYEGEGEPLIERVMQPPDADIGSYDFSSDLALLADSHNESTNEEDGEPDVIHLVTFSSYTQVATLDYVKAGHQAPVFQTHGFYTPTMWATLGDDANGQEGTTPVVAEDNAAGERFDSDLEKASGYRPTFFSPNYYDSVFMSAMAVVLARETAGSVTDVTGAQVRDALLKLDEEDGEVVYSGPDGFAQAVEHIGNGDAINYEGTSGPMDWGENQRAMNRVSHFKIEDGDYVVVKIYDCVASPDCLPMD